MARVARVQQAPPPVPAAGLIGQAESIYVKNPTYNIYILNTINPHFINVTDANLYSICYRPNRSGVGGVTYRLPNHNNQTVTIYHYSNYQGHAVNYTGTFSFIGIDVRDISVPLSYNRNQWVSASRSVFSELDTNLGFLIFAEGHHSGGRDVSNQYRIDRADTAKFPAFQVDRDIVLD